MTSSNSHWRTSFRVCIVRSFEKIDRIITVAHCIQCGAVITRPIFSKRHSIARPLGQGIGCISSVHLNYELYSASLTAVMYAVSCFILDRCITAPQGINDVHTVGSKPMPALRYPTNTTLSIEFAVLVPFLCTNYISMMTSSNGNIFHVTGHLCGEFTGDRWIPHTKASDAELWCFPWSAPD